MQDGQTSLQSAVNAKSTRAWAIFMPSSLLSFREARLSETEGLDECRGLHSVLRGGSIDSKKADFIREIRYLELVSERLC